MRSSSLLLERRAFLAGFGAVAATLAIFPSRMAARAVGRDTIYQRIWDADQATNGIPAIAAGETGDPARGFVKVDEPGGRDPDHRLFAEVRIPAHKRRTYDLCKALFDNYRLDQSRAEDNRPEEAREILELLDAVADSAPMAAAREHVEAENGGRWSRDAWQELIFEVWFRQFDDGRNRDLSGFEHVAVGEQKGGKVNGHHFWYVRLQVAQMRQKRQKSATFHHIPSNSPLRTGFEHRRLRWKDRTRPERNQNTL
jgi:hypothetical protein